MQIGIAMLRAIHAAFDKQEVKDRLKENAWFPEKFSSKSQFTTMAMLEMLTGLKTEYVFRNLGGQNPVVHPSGKGNANEYEQDWTSNDKYPAYQDWMLGPNNHDKPTPNWNPTVLFSKDRGVRALKPAPGGESFVHVYMQSSISKAWPYDTGGVAGMHDRRKAYSEIWSSTEDIAMVWIARLKLSHDNMAPLSAAPNRVGDEISKSGYFTLDESITVGA
jgi:hypothetical protein